jgi:hypothetical protein
MGVFHSAQRRVRQPKLAIKASPNAEPAKWRLVGLAFRWRGWIGSQHASVPNFVINSPRICPSI